MLDIKQIRKHPEQVQKNISKRGLDFSVEKLLALDREKLDLQTQLQEAAHEKNLLSRQVADRKKQGQDATDILESIQAVTQRIDNLDSWLQVKAAHLQELLVQLPNLLDDDILEHNEVLREYKSRPAFDFRLADHIELCRRHRLIDYDTAGSLTGSGYWIYRGMGARLEWALLNFCLQENQRAGYEMVMLPLVARKSCGFGAGQFPKFKDEVYLLQDTDHFLIPTAETLLVNFHQNQILEGDQLPLKYTAYTPCFRRESSKHPDERGLIRGHHFNKVELVQFATEAQADAAFDGIVAQAEQLMQQLDLHYRVVKLSAAECSAAMARTYDIEVWLPAEGVYKEVSSISNARTFQARRSNTRYRDSTGKIQYAHTLNGSGLATSRLFAAILEQNQTPSGGVRIPEVLVPWTGTDSL